MQQQNQQEEPLFSAESFRILQSKLSQLNQNQEEQDLLLDPPSDFKRQITSSEMSIAARPEIYQIEQQDESLLKDIVQGMENTLQNKILAISNSMNILAKQPIIQAPLEINPDPQNNEEKRSVTTEQFNSIDKLSQVPQLQMANLSQIQTISESKVIIDPKYISCGLPIHQQLLLSTENRLKHQNSDYLLLSQSWAKEKAFKIDADDCNQIKAPLIEVETQVPQSSQDHSNIDSTLISGKKDKNTNDVPIVYEQTTSPLIAPSMLVEISSNKKSNKVDLQMLINSSVSPQKAQQMQIQAFSTVEQQCNFLSEQPLRNYGEPMDIEETKVMVNQQAFIPMDIQTFNSQCKEKSYPTNQNQENNFSLEVNFNEDSKSHGPGDFFNQSLDRQKLVLEQITQKQSIQLQFISDNPVQNLTQGEDQIIQHSDHKSKMETVHIEQQKSESAKNSSRPTIDQSYEFQFEQIKIVQHSVQNNQQIQQLQQFQKETSVQDVQMGNKISNAQFGMQSNQNCRIIHLQDINIESQNELFMMEVNNTINISQIPASHNEIFKEIQPQNIQECIIKQGETISRENLEIQQNLESITSNDNNKTLQSKFENKSNKKSVYDQLSMQNNEKQMTLNESQAFKLLQNQNNQSKNQQFLQQITKTFDQSAKTSLTHMFQQPHFLQSRTKSPTSHNTQRKSNLNNAQTNSLPRKIAYRKAQQRLNAPLNSFKQQIVSVRMQKDNENQHEIYENPQIISEHGSIKSPKSIHPQLSLDQQQNMRRQYRDHSTQFSPKPTEPAFQKSLFQPSKHSNIIIFNQQSSKHYPRNENNFNENRMQETSINIKTPPIHPCITININKYNQISLNIFNNAQINQKVAQKISQDTNNEPTKVVQNQIETTLEQYNNIKNDPFPNTNDTTKQLQKIVNVFNETISLQQKINPIELPLLNQQELPINQQPIINKSTSLQQMPQARPAQETLEQQYSNICTIADNYLLRENRLQECDHIELEKAFEPHVLMRLTPQPISAVGRLIFKNGLLLIAMARMIARSSKTPFLMNHILQYFSGAFKIEENSYTFQQEYNKVKAQFYNYLQNQYIQKFNSNRIKQYEKQKQQTIKRTTLQLSEQSKNKKKQQNKLTRKQFQSKQLVLQSNFYSLSQQLKSIKKPTSTIFQNSQTQITPKKVQLPHLMLTKSSQMAKVSPTQKIDKIETQKSSKTDNISNSLPPVQENRSQATQQTVQSPPLGDKNLANLSLQILESIPCKKPEKKIEKSKKRQAESKNPPISKQKNTEKANIVSEQKPSNSKAQDSAKGSQFNQYIDLYDRYKRIRDNKRNEMASPVINEPTSIFRPSIVESKDHPVQKKEKRVQFAEEPIIIMAKQENSTDSTENMAERVKKRKRSKRNNNNDSSLEQDNTRRM